MSLEIVGALASGLVSGLGIWFWTQHHTHPEFVNRNEFGLLRNLITSQHEATLRELEQLRDLVDRHSKR